MTIRTIVVDIDNANFSGNVGYHLVNQATGETLAVASGSANGIIATPGTATITTDITADTVVRLCVGGLNIENEYYDHTMTTTQDYTYDITANTEVVALFANESITVSNASLGTLAWDSRIDSVTVDTANLTINPPDTIGGFPVAWAYRKWKKTCDANLRLMTLGKPMVGSNQSQPTGITNQTHLWYPAFEFGDNWAIDVNSTRSANVSLELSASGLTRSDTGNRNNLVYVSPLANGANPILKIIRGSASNFEAESTQSLDTLNVNVASILTAVELIRKIVRDEIG